MSIKPCIRRNGSGIVAETPFNEGWVGAIKHVIPKHDRGFNNGVWQFDAKHYAGVLAITQHYFGNQIIDSTGGIAAPQSSTWKERFDVWIASGEKMDQEYRKKGWDSVNQKQEKFDPFDVLFVTKNAPKEVIVAAHRVLSSIFHPDKGGDEETMKRINSAFQLLKKQGKV